MAEDQSDATNPTQMGLTPEEKPNHAKSAEPAQEDEVGLEAVYDVPVQISAVLGRVTMSVNQLLKLGRGAVLELDRRVGENVDIYVNNRLVARGEVVVMEENLGVTLTEILRSNMEK